MVEEASDTLVDDIKIKVIKDAIRDAEVSEKSVLERYGLDDFSKMTMGDWNKAMGILKKFYGDKIGKAAS